MYTGNQLNQIIKQTLFVIILLCSFGVMIKELNYFFSSILGAFTLYMLLRKPYRKLISKGWNKTLATSFLLIITVIIVFVVGGAFLGTIYNKIKDFQPRIIQENLNNIHEFVLQKTNYNIFSKEVADRILQTATRMLPNIFATTGNIVANSLMMIFLLFFMLQDSRAMEAKIERNLPLSKESVAMLKFETQNMVISNAIGIPVILIGQAIFAGIGYWFLDAGDPFVWGLLTGLFGLIPIIGTAGIWLPLAINLIVAGNIGQGIALILYGAIVVSSIDNIIRIVFLKRYANVHPLITIFGIILGMNLFGFWGIIFGPLMISGLIVLFKIYKLEFLTD